MKNVLVLVHDDEGQEARLQVAFDMVRALDGHLVCLDVELLPMVAADAYSGMEVARLACAEHDKSAANRARITQNLSREGIAWDWHRVIGMPDTAIENAIGQADVLVLSSHLDKGDTVELRQLANRIVSRIRRPVLAVPKTCKGLDLHGTVLVAWDGSREADQVLHDAVPLLGLAGEVILIDIDEPKGPFALESAATYLSRHGIHPSVEVMQVESGQTIYSAILKRAHAARAAYVVMGAYGHSPTIETFFGGVTRSMLANSDLPVLLSH